MSDELIDMHNRITTEELDRLVRHQLKQILPLRRFMTQSIMKISGS